MAKEAFLLIKEMYKLSVIVIAKDEEKKIGGALKSVVGLADEVLVLDGGSTDKTVAIAKSQNARVERQIGKTYSDWRNQGLKEAKGKWIFYLDADERVTPALATEIENELKNPQFDAYAIPRRNIILGAEMKHGGWWPDYVKRLFARQKIKRWVGELHEEPIVEGDFGYFKSALIHQKHDNLSEMVEKTNKWSDIEAKLLFNSNHPSMSWWRFLRIMLGEFWYRLFWRLGVLDGTKGVIYNLYQVCSRFMTYAKLWEMQNEKAI